MRVKFKTLFLVVLAVSGVAMRLLPHLPDMTPMLAVALFSGAYLEKRLGLIVAVGSLFVSDLFLGFYPGMGFVYLGIVSAVMIGFWIGQKQGIWRLMSGTMGAAALFFLVSNFGAWVSLPMYPKTVAGLTWAYIEGIPFFRNALAGDFLFVAVLFGLAKGFDLLTIHGIRLRSRCFGGPKIGRQTNE